MEVRYSFTQDREASPIELRGWIRDDRSVDNTRPIDKKKRQYYYNTGVHITSILFAALQCIQKFLPTLTTVHNTQRQSFYLCLCFQSCMFGPNKHHQHNASMPTD